MSDKKNTFSFTDHQFQTSAIWKYKVFKRNVKKPTDKNFLNLLESKGISKNQGITSTIQEINCPIMSPALDYFDS